MAGYSTRPGNDEVQARDVHFRFDQQTLSRHWLQDPWITHTVNALVLFVPEGERWVIQSAREILPHLKDPELIAATRQFIRQEAIHSREHDRMNKVIDSYQLPVKDAEQVLKSIRGQFDRLRSPAFNAAMGAAFEHFTATFADAVLQSPDLLDSMDPEIRALACWHLVEETEHKAMSFDLFTSVAGEGARAYAIRVAGMLATLGVLLPMTEVTFLRLLYLDGELTNFRSMGHWVRRLYLNDGTLTRTFRGVMKYFRPGFHPWEDDNRKRIDPWRETFARTNDPHEAARVLMQHLWQEHRESLPAGAEALPAAA